MTMTHIQFIDELNKDPPGMFWMSKQWLENLEQEPRTSVLSHLKSMRYIQIMEQEDQMLMSTREAIQKLQEDGSGCCDHGCGCSH